MDSLHCLEDFKRAVRFLSPCQPGVVRRAQDSGVLARRQNRLDELVKPKRPEALVADHQTVQEGRAASVDPDDENRPVDPPRRDLRVTLRFPGDLGVLVQEAAHFEDDISELVVQEPSLRQLQCPDELLQGLA